jgi:hypothetical protein
MLLRYFPTYVKYNLRKESGNIHTLSMQAGVFDADILLSALMCHFAFAIPHKTKKD